jgi:GNAT superfamily N-acetyltransferase
MSLHYRLATANDVPVIVRMLADDTLGSQREKSNDAVSGKYTKAFERIAADPNQELTVVELDGEIVATFQLSFIQYLTYEGGIRAQVEAVRTSSAHRGQGIGSKVFDYIIERAKQKGCHMVQLTSDKKRTDAIRFYESKGFVSTHEGMKLHLGK